MMSFIFLSLNFEMSPFLIFVVFKKKVAVGSVFNLLTVPAEF